MATHYSILAGKFYGQRSLAGYSPAAAAKSFQSCLTLCDPIDPAHQAPPSLGFSRQEHWSGLPFPSPMHESEAAQSCPTLRDSMDFSLPGSFIHGIFQARVLEWGAIAFSEATVHGVTKESQLSGHLSLSSKDGCTMTSHNNIQILEG